jgi:hypothetical protein
VLTAAAAAVAGVSGRPVWAAALGAGLVLGYWLLEALARRRGELSASFNAAVGIALGGMVLRMFVVLGVLVLVGVLARPAFGTAAVAFLLSFSVYGALRLLTFAGAAPSPAGRSAAAQDRRRDGGPRAAGEARP